VIDADLVGKRLAFIETAVERIRRMPYLHTDRDEACFLYNLNSVVSAARDAARQLVPGADRPFATLADRAVIPYELSRQLRRLDAAGRMIGRAEVEIDASEMRIAIEPRLPDLLSFVALIRPLL